MKYARSGFTLMELLVYMAVVGIVVVIAGQAFSNSTKFRIRTDNMIKSTHEAEEVAALLKADVQQTGAKYSKEATVAGDDDTFEGHVANVYMVPGSDLSSFKIEPVAGSSVYDHLTIRYLRYDEQGRYQATEQVEWFVDAPSKSLKRTCKLLDKLATYNPKRDPCSEGANSTPDPIEMATGVEKFKVYPAIPSIRSNADAAHQEEQVFPPGNMDVFKLVTRTDLPNIVAPTAVSGGGTGVSVNGFVQNGAAELRKNELYVAANTDVAGTWNNVCQKFTLETGIEYEISFALAYPNDEADGAQLFVPGRDHMSVGFRNNGLPVPSLDDFLFYPPTSTTSQGKRTMRFTVPQNIENVCMAFTFATYSPLAGHGTVVVSNLKLKRIAGSNYVFGTGTLPDEDKKNVKALKLELEVGRGGKNNKAGETGHIDIVVPIPSNGVGI